MVGGTAPHHQQQQSSQLAPPLSSASTEEEEFLKRNTDCVYFLASPLTCKKGSECEYRHSEIARVNTRDCWYWLNGNCLNPKCAFRHPPLDGLLGAEIPTPVAPLQSPATPATTYAMPKQGVACIFFQKGFCLKGHLCPFLHGPPNSINNKPPPAGPANPVTEPPKTAISGPEKSNAQKLDFLPPHGKQPPRIQPPPPARNGGGAASVKVVPPPMVHQEPARHRPTTAVPPPPPPPVVNEVSAGKDGDEYSREPSPGFDVLVDNELGDSEYYHNEEQFGRSRDYDTGHATDFDFDVDRDMYRDYDRYNDLDRDRVQYRDDHRVSSETKPYPRSDSPDRFDESDLRYRISSQRRVNNTGLRSVVSRENADDRRADRIPRRDHHHQNHHHSHHHRPAQTSISSRLRGRIQIPGRSTSPGDKNDLRVEREIQHRSRYSSERPVQSRLRDRIKGRSSDDFNNEGSNSRSSRGRRDMGSDNDTEFSGPKRLSELKSGKTREDDRQSLGKRKYPIVDQSQSQPPVEDRSFKGPMPLSEILKRKRRTGTTTTLDTQVSNVNNEDNYLKEINEKETKTSSGIKTEMIKEESNEKEIESINREKNKLIDGESSMNHEETEEGMMDEDAILDEELEAYDHKDGDYDYDQIDGEDYNLEEGEEGYLDEEEEDDYEKKESVVYS